MSTTYEDLLYQNAIVFDRPFGVLDIRMSVHDNRRTHKFLQRLVREGQLVVANPHVDGRKFTNILYEWAPDD